MYGSAAPEDYSEMYGSMPKLLPPYIYEIAESRPYRFWDSYRKGSVKGSDWFKDGSKWKFSTVEDLYSACCQWVVWMEQHPLFAEKQFAYQGEITIHAEPRPRVLTETSLLKFLRSDQKDWSHWPTRGEEWGRLRDEVRNWIWLDKFEGVNAGFYNANIIAAHLGLSQKISAEISGKNGGPITTRSEVLSKGELEKELEDLGLPKDMLEPFLGSDESGTE